MAELIPPLEFIEYWIKDKFPNYHKTQPTMTDTFETVHEIVDKAYAQGAEHSIKVIESQMIPHPGYRNFNPIELGINQKLNACIGKIKELIVKK